MEASLYIAFTHVVHRMVPAFVAVTAAAGAYLLGKSTKVDRTTGKKNKKVIASDPTRHALCMLFLKSATAGCVRY